MNASSESGVCPTDISTFYNENLVIITKVLAYINKSKNTLYSSMICASCENHKHFECIDCQNNHTTNLCSCDCHLTDHEHAKKS